MLSYHKGGHEVAVLEGPHQTKFVYLDRHPTKEALKEGLSESEMNELLVLQLGKDYIKNHGKSRYSLKISKLEAPEGSQFLPFVPEDLNGDRIVHYIFGASGSGKSYLAKKLSAIYNKMVDVYIVSPVEDEGYSGTFVSLEDLVRYDDSNSYEKQKKAYEDARIKFKYAKRSGAIQDPELLMAMEIKINTLKPKRNARRLFKFTKLYEEMIERPTLFIYDDTEATDDQEMLQFLQNSQLVTGRHTKINVLLLNHMPNQLGNKTRNIINEAHLFTFFEINKYTQYFSKVYLSLDYKKQRKVEEMLEHSRYVSINKKMKILQSSRVMYTY